jgi:hypothetical protein
LPDSIDITAVFGLAALIDKADALRIALFLLSDPGQAILSRRGLLPILAGDRDEAVICARGWAGCSSTRFVPG